MTELESWKSDAFRLMAENLKLEKQRDRLLEAMKRFTEYGDVFLYRRGETSPYQDAVNIIAEIEAEK